jgi:hypothetical protein
MNTSSTTTFLAVFLLVISAASWADLSAVVDRNVLDSNETLQLVIRYDGQATNSEPDFSPLEKDFEILSNNRQQQYSWVNGQSESYTDWSLVLLPKRTGIILIPSLAYKKETSNGLEIRVRAASNQASAGKQPIYTETLVDKNAVYLQEQVVLTQRLYTSVKLTDLSLSELEVTNAIVQRIGDTQFQKIINGRNYLIVEVKYALFPQVSGKLDIPPLRFGAYESNNRGSFGGFSSRGNKLFRTTEAKTIDVMAVPTYISPSQWMPSSGLTLTEKWSADLDQLTAGEPITRTIEISAAGLTGAQILPLSIDDSDAYKTYPDQPRIDQQANAEGILGTRIETLAMVPSRAGEVTFPEINVRWWDTINERMQTTNIPSKTVQVAPAIIEQPNGTEVAEATIQTPVSTPLAIDSGDNQPSQLIKWSMTLNVLLITALVTLLLLRRQPSRSSRANFNNEADNQAQLNLMQKLKSIETQAKGNNLPAMREKILDWGRSLYPKTLTLKQLAQQLNDESLQQLFDQLDNHLYKNVPSDDLDIALLMERLKHHTAKSGSRGRRKSQGQGLQPLYPSQ